MGRNTVCSPTDMANTCIDKTNRNRWPTLLHDNSYNSYKSKGQLATLMPKKFLTLKASVGV